MQLNHLKSSILNEYLDFLRDFQCLSESTIIIRRNFVEPFLLKMGVLDKSTLNKISSATIHNYIIATAPNLHRASKKHLTSSIRSFLRFAHIKGYLIDLVNAVPVMHIRKLDRLPQGISWEEAQKLLLLPDRQTHAGRRDFAILLLLIRYGVRIGQITTLKLQSIHWQEGVIRFEACKHSNSLQLPLYEEVAEALFSYIKNDRYKSQFHEVFLTIQNPQRPLSEHNKYYENIAKYYKKAGITLPSMGSRSIRHAFATQLVKQHVPFKTIADLLGHRYIETTFIYTKVDVDQLRELSRQWPNERVVL